MKKNSVFFVYTLLSFFLLGCNNYFIKAVRSTYFKGNNTTSIYDASLFYSRTVKTSVPQFFQKDTAYNEHTLSDTCLQELEKYKTRAFLILKKGKIFYEKYWDVKDTLQASNSFSMAKTVISLLLGIAIEEKYIQSLDQSIIDFLPEFKQDSLAQNVSIRDLVSMSSGYDWVEKHFHPFNPTTKIYYGNDVGEVVFQRKFIHPSKQKFQYSSGASQLLGYVIARATKQHLAEYLSQKLWQPLGMETEALWTLDHKEGMEKSFCCIHSNAHDFAKLGQLVLQKGKWNGKQLVDSHYIFVATHPDITSFYGLSFWMDYQCKNPFFLFRGHLGQYIIIVPSQDLVIVRLGEKRNFLKNKNPHKTLPEHIYQYVNEAISITAP